MARCPDCGYPAQDPVAPCERCGYQPYGSAAGHSAVSWERSAAPAAEMLLEVAPRRRLREAGRRVGYGEYYFPIACSKLIVLSVTTFGIYQLVWFYKQWRFLKESGEPELRLIPRTIFSGIFAYPMFRRVHEHAEQCGVGTRWGPGPLTCGYILSGWVAALGGWYLFVSLLLNALALVAVQSTILRINAASSPPAAPDRTYSLWNVVAILFGSAFLLLIVIGMLYGGKTAPAGSV